MGRENRLLCDLDSQHADQGRGTQVALPTNEGLGCCGTWECTLENLAWKPRVQTWSGAASIKGPCQSLTRSTNTDAAADERRPEPGVLNAELTTAAAPRSRGRA